MFSAHCIVTGICAKITDNYLLLACFDNFDITGMLSFNIKYFFLNSNTTTHSFDTKKCSLSNQKKKKNSLSSSVKTFWLNCKLYTPKIWCV